MAVDEAARHELYTRLEEALGRGPTSTMMELLPPTGWSDVARTRDLDDLRGEMNASFVDVDARFVDVRAEMRTGFAEIRTELAELRTEIATQRADTDDAMRRQTITLVGTMATISGLTIAAAGLL